MRGLCELLGGGGEPLLGALQVLLEQLDASVEGGDLTLGLNEEGRTVNATSGSIAFEQTDRGSQPFIQGPLNAGPI